MNILTRPSANLFRPSQMKVDGRTLDRFGTFDKQTGVPVSVVVVETRVVSATKVDDSYFQTISEKNVRVDTYNLTNWLIANENFKEP